MTIDTGGAAKYDTTIQTRTVTERVETRHTDYIDWDYPFVEACKRVGCNVPAEERAAKAIEKLRACENHKDNPLMVTSDGGWPRCGWRGVIGVGMVSKWPYWTPRPCVLTVSPLGGSEWMDWDSITDVCIKSEATP